MRGVELLLVVERARPRPQDDGEGDVRLESARVPAAAAWFLDEFRFHSVVRRPDGDLDVEIAYHDRAWLLRFLLGHADVVRAADPELSAEVARRAGEGLEAYSAEPGETSVTES